MAGAGNRVNFNVNGRPHNVGSELELNTSLNDYLRNILDLRGTKSMCLEGGCGACIVAVQTKDPLTGNVKKFSVNSCLVLVFSCEGWDITTVEGIGDRVVGYHPVQVRLARFNGSQCGYCSPGFVMQMYSILGKDMSMKQIEDSFGSNTCRCTGYRPILDAFKTFASDIEPNLNKKLKDIEDLDKCKTQACYRSVKNCERQDNNGNMQCNGDKYQSNNDNINCLRTKDDFSICNEGGWCIVDDEQANTIEIHFDKHIIYKVYNVNEIFNIFKTIDDKSYMLLSGNTAKGTQSEVLCYPQVLIDISSVYILKKSYVNQNLVLGGGMTLTAVIELFENLSQTDSNFNYLQEFAEHIKLVAHVPVRNIGTIAGNLMIKHEHKSFPSDIFVIFETVRATIVLQDATQTKEVSMTEFLSTDMRKVLIREIHLPPISKHYKIRTYKIMERSQNVHAIVNAGFMTEIDPLTSKILNISLVFGGISCEFIHAKDTEKYLIGKVLFTNEELQAAIKLINNEINPEYEPTELDPEVRKKLAVGIFYKFVLNICPSSLLNPKLRSGGEKPCRPVSSGWQEFYTDKSQYPITEPMPKLESLLQCSGQARYSNDVKKQVGEVFAAFVLSTVASGDIDMIYSEEVLNIPGVVNVFTAKDIPGKNTFTSPGLLTIRDEEEILCSSRVRFYGQPVAIVVADTRTLAERAAKIVNVTYKNVTKPILTIKEAKKVPGRIQTLGIILPVTNGHDIRKIIKGCFDTYYQYHYTMEPQTCVVVPEEQLLKVYSSTQFITLVNSAIAESLNISQNRIQVVVSRVGGAFGGKISRSGLVAAACALVTFLTNRTCRIAMSMTTNMSAIGKRCPSSIDYEAGVDTEGVIQYMDMSFFTNSGHVNNEGYGYTTLSSIRGCYNTTSWRVSYNCVITDTPANSFCRAPGSVESIGAIEQIMERIAFELNLDPIEVRKNNMTINPTVLEASLEEFKRKNQYEDRLTSVKCFNSKNRWKKKALKLSLMTFPVEFIGQYNSEVLVYLDGTVAVKMTGIELGQGMYTKVAQTCARELRIPLDMVTVLPSDNFIGSVDTFTGFSSTTDSYCNATSEACKKLLEQIDPLNLIPNSSTFIWKELVLIASMTGRHLKAQHTFKPKLTKEYITSGIVLMEIVLDVLTAEHQILRTDIYVDSGQSINPELTVGQVEGAFIQGLGYWTMEKIVMNESTGEVLTNRSWNYSVPLAKDIPINFRIELSNSGNKSGINGDKSMSEAPICMSVVIVHCLREAIMESRRQSGYPDQWLHLKMPCNKESKLEAAEIRLEEFVLY